MDGFYGCARTPDRGIPISKSRADIIIFHINDITDSYTFFLSEYFKKYVIESTLNM
jgi:hypothetical protein